jgi:hypothetical protein
MAHLAHLERQTTSLHSQEEVVSLPKLHAMEVTKVYGGNGGKALRFLKLTLDGGETDSKA